MARRMASVPGSSQRSPARRAIALRALGTDPPEETLSDHADERRREYIGLDAHLRETGHGLGGIVRVQSSMGSSTVTMFTSGERMSFIAP